MTIYSPKKKVMSLLLAVLMLLSTAAPAFADVFAFVTVEEEEAPVYGAGVLTAELDGYTVTVGYDEAAQIPDGAELFLYEYVEGTLQYDEYKAAAEASVLGEDEETVFARFFDITISCTDPATGETVKVEPAAPVDVEIQSAQLTEAEKVSVVHFPDPTATPTAEQGMDQVVEEAIEAAFGKEALKANKGTLKAGLTVEGDEPVADLPTVENDVETPAMEVLETETVGEGVVAFTADGFSVYGIVGTTLIKEVTLTSPDGEEQSYVVSVTIPPEANIPTVEDVVVRQYTDADIEYIEARNLIIDKKLAENPDWTEDGFGFTAIDISLVDENGNELEPEVPVSVSISIKELPTECRNDIVVRSLEIGHVEEVDGIIDVVPVARAGVASLDENGNITVIFPVGGFSTFPLTWGENSATIYYGELLDGSFTEFAEDKVALLDTSASTVSLKNNFDGYVYSLTHYIHGNEDVLIEPVLYKVQDGEGYKWQVDMHIYNESTEAYTIQRRDIEPNSRINVQFVKKSNNNTNPQSGDDVQGPNTVKTVTDNHDGTYEITIDTSAPTVTTVDKVGANVLIVLDRTRSMLYNMENDNTATNPANYRWTAAKDAIDTLVTVLSTGGNAQNDIQYGLISFYRLTDGQETNNLSGTGYNPTLPTPPLYYVLGNNNSPWTSDATAFNNFIQNGTSINGHTLKLPNGLDNTTNGTNWEDPLYRAYQLVNNSTLTDNDKTYIIFVTDGSPNARGTGETGNAYTGYVQNGQTDAINAAVTRAQAIYQSEKAELYGVFCGSTTGGYTTLDNMLTSAATAAGISNRPETLNGSDSDAINDAFRSIAHTIVNNLGSSSVSVDDGVPSLASISAQTVGVAGGYKYYKKGPNDTDFVEWEGAPGATYSKDNGVTWDLSTVSTLAQNTTYRIKFTVWPSQAAYDKIADLNNGVVTMTDNELTEAGIRKIPVIDPETGETTYTYELNTNTHLQTTYSYNGNTYTDPSTWTQEEMPLPTETVTITKIWNNPTDWHIGDDSGEGVQLYLTKDGVNYLYEDNAITVAPDSENDLVWESTQAIYISCGNISQDNSTHEYVVHENGHDYSIAEPASFSYYWDLKADVYHPMVINGTAHYLIQNDEATGTDGIDYYKLKGADGKDHIYVLADTGGHVLTATNDRRSNLNLKKAINDQSTDQGVDKDTLFEYTITINNSRQDTGSATDLNSDYYVWFSAMLDDGSEEIIKNLDVTSATGERRTVDSSDSRVSEFSYNAEAGTVSYRWNGGDLTTYPYATYDGGSIYSYPTGYFYAPSGSSFTANIKEGWNLRFINLPIDTTYTIVETVEGDWEFEGAEGSAIKYEKDDSGHAVEVNEAYAVTVNTGTATIGGTIAESNHSYTVIATNIWEPTGNNLTVNKVWNSGTYVSTHGIVSVALFRDKNNDGNYTAAEYIDGTIRNFLESLTITYQNISSLEGLSVREVVIATEGTGDDAVTTVTPIDANNFIIVSGETMSSGSTNAENPYKVTYAGPTNGVFTVTNTYETVEVSATKAWQNADGSTTAPSGANVIFTLYKDGTATNQTVTLDGNIDDNGESAAWKATFKDLPQYKVVNGDAVAIVYTIGETTTYPGYAMVTTSHPVANDGTITNAQSAISIDMIKVDNSTSAKPLGDAEFNLYSDLELTEQITTDANGISIGTNGVIKTAADGTATIGTLTVGTYYLVETKAPDGFNQMTSPVVITVRGITNAPYVEVSYTQADYAASQTTGLIQKTDSSGTIIGYTITVENKNGAVLPSTGASHPFLYTAFGLAMVSTVGLVLHHRRKEQTED